MTPETSNPRKTDNQIFYEIAMAMGNTVRTHVILVCASGILMAVLRRSYEYVNGPLDIVVYEALSCALGAVVLGTLISSLAAPWNGRLILREIEREFGPRTREHVFKLFAKTQPGIPIDLYIPAIAHAYGEI